MKIISNFKDYYDPMVSVFGRDETVVYERLSQKKVQNNWVKFREEKQELKGYNFNGFAVNGRIYVCCVFDSKFIAVDEVEGIIKGDKQTFGYYNYWKEKKLLPYHDTITNLNDQFNCPVMLLSYGNVPQDWLNKKGLIFEPKILNPNLTFYKFQNVLSEDAIFSEITNFLTKEKPFVDTRTDLQKVVSNGFDKKTSFRNVK